MPPFPELLEHLLGLSRGPDELLFRHMAVRATVVFLWAILVARLADRRFLGANAIFDVMLGVIFASVSSRAINGEAAFFPSLGAALVLVLLHRLLGTLAYRSHRLSVILKGRDRLLVRNGRAIEEELRRNRITAADLAENLRLAGRVLGVEQVAEARLERNGNISVVPARSGSSDRTADGRTDH